MNSKIKRGLIVGRFQPWHLGHHKAIINLLKEVDELVIVVGSSMESHQLENPFTAGERIEMIAAALKSTDLYERCFIIPIPDVSQNALWTAQIKGQAPKFDVVYTNNPLVKQLFEGEGFKTREMVSGLPEVNSTSVREAMFGKDNWEKMLPKVVVEYLNGINAMDRIRAIAEKEKKQ